MKTSAVSTALTMNVSELTAGVQAASGSLKKLGKTATDIQKQTGKLVFLEQLRAGVAVAKGAVGALSGIVRSASDFVTVNTEIIRGQITLAEQLGVTQAQVVGLGQAAANAGIEASQLYEPLSKIGPLVQRAVEGNKEALAVFDQLGLSAEKLAKSTAFEQFGAFADAITDIQDANQQALILSKIAGESGLRFREFFAAGSEGFRQLTKESAQLGLGIGEAGVQSIKILDEAIRSAKDAVQGLRNLILVDLAPDITKALKGFTERLKIPEFRTRVVDALASAGRFAIDLAKKAAAFLLDLADVLASTIGKINGLADSLGKWSKSVPGEGLSNAVWPEWLKNPPAPEQLTGGGGGWGDGGDGGRATEGIREGFKGIFDSINGLVEETAKSLKGRPAPAAGNQGKEAAQVQEKNVVAVKELTKAVEQNTKQLLGLADGDDIRTSAGMQTLQSVNADGFGQPKIVRLLERMVEKLDKANQNRPAPVNL